MARPHIEFIQAQALPWDASVYRDFRPGADAKVLSPDGLDHSARMALEEKAITFILKIGGPCKRLAGRADRKQQRRTRRFRAIIRDQIFQFSQQLLLVAVGVRFRCREDVVVQITRR